MAHKTLVGGTAYDTKGGKCLVGGTAYSIKKGRTLVGGTGYDVLFRPTVPTVTIRGSGNSSNCYAIIAGKTYISAASDITVKAGDVITFRVYTNTRDNSGLLLLNTPDGDQTTLTYTNSGGRTYNWTVPSGYMDITIRLDYTNVDGEKNGSIFITLKR